MLENAQNALPYITGALFALGLLLFMLSLRMFRRSRADVFWRRRRDAGQRGWRALVLSSVLIVLSVLSCMLTAVATIMNQDESTPAPTGVLIEPSPSLLPTETPARNHNAPGN